MQNLGLKFLSSIDNFKHFFQLDTLPLGDFVPDNLINLNMLLRLFFYFY